jgi:hypothetical protein
VSEGERTIEVVRGALDEELAQRILAFWAQHSALPADVARDRLPEVVCVLRGAAGDVLGVTSVTAAGIPEIGARRFWVHRSLLAPATGETAWDDLLAACFDALAAEFEAMGESPKLPVGVCTLVGDPAILERRPEAVWPDLRFLYAGYRPDGRQMRIRYFEEGRI